MLKALTLDSFFFMLSRAIWALFLSILIQNGQKKTQSIIFVFLFLGGCMPFASPSVSATAQCNVKWL